LECIIPKRQHPTRRRMKNSRIPFDYFLDHESSAEIRGEEKAAELRMRIIMQNGNTGEHYNMNNDSGIHDTYDDADTDPNE